MYDKEYVARVTKLKAGPTKWDPENLYRHPDFGPREKTKTNAHTKSKGGLPQTMRANHIDLDDTSTGC